ncbi:flagellar hook-basal body complex protein FliE [Sinomonas halotolerans]|uniref:Flagellar hook-basal body complex protein FliE n=1 Tax=Sinomonas halotolerans TaxID=1644133 RepID=A0ABU9WZ63_9MICC
MSIEPIGAAVGAMVRGTAPTTLGAAVTPGTQGTTPVRGAGGEAFAATLAGAVDGLQQLQSTAKELGVRAVTGSLTDVHDATIAATRAQVTLELAAAVRNKAVEGFNEIMRMQA